MCGWIYGISSQKSAEFESVDLFLVLAASHLQCQIHARADLSQFFLSGLQLLLAFVQLAAQVEVLVEDEDEVIAKELYFCGDSGDEARQLFFVVTGIEVSYSSEDIIDGGEDVLPAVQHS